jgi:hypothetical protein
MTNDKGKLMEEFFKDAPKITLSENEQAYYAERVMTARGDDEVKKIMEEISSKMPGFRDELNKHARKFEKKHKLDEKNKGTNTGRV